MFGSHSRGELTSYGALKREGPLLAYGYDRISFEFADGWLLTLALSSDDDGAFLSVHEHDQNETNKFLSAIVQTDFDIKNEGTMRIHNLFLPSSFAYAEMHVIRTHTRAEDSTDEQSEWTSTWIYLFFSVSFSRFCVGMNDVPFEKLTKNDWDGIKREKKNPFSIRNWTRTQQQWNPERQASFLLCCCCCVRNVAFGDKKRPQVHIAYT